MRQRLGLIIVVVLYLLVSVATLVVWDARGVYGATGDEPHYLVIADALVTDASPEVTDSYYREFSQRRWYPRGLGNPAEALAPPTAHVVGVGGSNFSWHGLGIPILAALPVAAVGETGARLVVIAIGALGLFIAWALAGVYLSTRKSRTLAVAAVALSYPVVLASTQIYPDLMGGVLLLFVLTWWVHPRWRTHAGWTITAALAASFIPWLGSRFWIAGAISVLALAVASRGSRVRLGWILGIAAVSAVALISYHLYAFGSVLGPPSEGALNWTWGAFMVGTGLIWDQNQGLLFSNPVLWLTLPGLILLWRRQRSAFSLWVVLFLAVLIPAAAHPGFYGLGSFNGRYGWPLSVMAFLPTFLALAFLASRHRRWFALIVVAGIAFQAYLIGLSLFIGGSGPGSPAGLDLYTKPTSTWLESYSAWWYPLERFLPAWYNPDWSFTFGPNWIWLLTSVALILVFVMAPRWWKLAVLVMIPLVIAAGLIAQPGARAIAEAQDVQLIAGVDSAGYPVTGPIHLMRQGPYTWWVSYAAAGSGAVGKWELVRAIDDVVVAAGELQGTGSVNRTENVTVPFRSFQPREFVFRIGWYATQDMTIKQTGVRHGGPMPE